MKMPGNLIGLKIDGNFVDCETSCEVSWETDLLPASPQDSGGWKEYIAGVRSWSVTLNAAMLLRMSGTGLNTILNAFLTGGNMAVRVTTKRQDLYPSFTIYGNVILQNGGLSAAVNSMASWNATLQGNGKMNIEINTNTNYLIATSTTSNEVIEDGNNNLILGTKE